LKLRSQVEKRILSQSPSWDPLGGLLWTISLGYRAVVGLRNSWYDSTWSRKRRLPSPVISVGNLTVGGSGKTPFVMLIATTLAQKGFKVAVLSRGYGRKGRMGILKVSDGRGPSVGPKEAGDEPYLMAKKLRNVAVWVGTDRFEAGLECWRESRPEVFILDDGFQHRDLLRDLDIVLVRFPRPWGNGRLLPAGPLREPLSGLKRADVLVVNSYGEWDLVRFHGLPGRGFVFLRARLVPKAIRHLGGEETLPISSLKGSEVVAFCGIGTPDSFRRTLLGTGVRLGPFLSFPDHHWYTPQDVQEVRRLSKKDALLITTEKDACKLEELGSDLKGIWALEIEMTAEPLWILEQILEEALISKADPGGGREPLTGP